MTQAAFVTKTIDRPTRYPHIFGGDKENSVRSILASARPLLPDDMSRRTKLLTAKKIWRESKPARLSVLNEYFNNLGLMRDAALPDDVRFHASVLFEPTREQMPAMIVPVRDLEGTFVGIHRTYLTRDGRALAKHPHESRRMLGDCFGYYVQLVPATSHRLVIVETVEMALLVHESCPDMPVWSSMTLGNMKSPLPASVREITLCVNGSKQIPDKTTQVLRDAVRTHMSRGVTVRVSRPLTAQREQTRQAIFRS